MNNNNKKLARRDKIIDKAKALGIEANLEELTLKEITNLIKLAEAQNRLMVVDSVFWEQELTARLQEQQQEQTVRELQTSNHIQRVQQSSLDIDIYPHNVAIFKCVKEGNWLRIKFHIFRDRKGKTYSSAYNDTYNCQFPKNIRAEGRFYEIPDSDIYLSEGRNQPFYLIRKKNIKIIQSQDFESRPQVQIYAIEECIICMDVKPNIVYFPCGHQCSCQQCSNSYFQSTYQKRCPLCRREVIASNKV